MYFEPLSAEDVLAVCEAERPVGVLCQMGGQTPLRLAHDLGRRGGRCSALPDAIDLAEDRGRFARLLQELEIPPAARRADGPEQARTVSELIGYPVVVRPSYVLGGRAMEIVYGPDELERFVAGAAAASPDHPVLIDRFVEGAVEIDVDAVCDGTDVFVGAVMEHRGGGDPLRRLVVSIPPATLSEDELDEIERITATLARRLGVRGLINLQLALKDERIWCSRPTRGRPAPFRSSRRRPASRSRGSRRSWCSGERSRTCGTRA